MEDRAASSGQSPRQSQFDGVGRPRAWNAISGLRNRIVHDYMNVNMDQVVVLVTAGRDQLVAMFFVKEFCSMKSASSHRQSSVSSSLIYSSNPTMLSTRRSISG